MAQARHKTPQQVDQIAQGRVWDGGSAHQLGLVDGFGGMSEAIAKAAQLANLGNERRVRYLEAPKTFREQLLAALASQGSDDSAAPPDAFAALTRQPQEQLARAVAEVQTILTGPSIQARCLECAAAEPAPPLRQRDMSLLAMLKGWLG